MKKPRLLLGDDHALILRGITGLLESEYEVVGTAKDGVELVDAALRLKPEIVVLDISMPLLNGIDAARRIREELPATLLIFLTMHTNAVYLRKALQSGASGYVLKAGASEELLAAIREARNGKIYISPGFGREVVDEAEHPGDRGAKTPPDLTDRQRQILQLVAEGRQNKEIAEIVHLSVKTVDFHRGRLMAKLGAHSVAELTRFAMEEGLIAREGWEA